MSEKFNSFILKTLKLYGFTLERKYYGTIIHYIKSLSDKEQQQWLAKLAEQLLSQNLKSSQIQLADLKKAIEATMTPEDDLNSQQFFTVVNAADIPRINYDLTKRKFVVEQSQIDLYPDNANWKTEVFKRRLELLWNRTLRNPLFLESKFTDVNEEKVKLTQIEFLLSEAVTGTVHVMGILSQLTEGQLWLEDCGGSVKVDLKGADFKPGFIAEGTVVIVSGKYYDGLLRVKEIGLPPPESSTLSRADFGDTNTFGGPQLTSCKTSDKMKAIEDTYKDGMLVFVSEVWLDDVKTLNKLKSMIEGYSQCPPVAFVICGQFLSFPPCKASSEKMREGFKRLAEIVVSCPAIVKHSTFIFVPSLRDVGSATVLPRSPLPKCLMQDFLKAVPRTVLATNPCRIKYCTKEIVVFREDILNKFLRNSFKLPAEGHVYDHYAKTIVCESHLTPMVLPVEPIYWKHDGAMQLFPTPDLIVVADKFEAYATKYSNCNVINPGSFSKNNYQFKVYFPSDNAIEDCEIANDDETM